MSVTPSSSRPLVSQSSVRRSLPTPPTRTPAKHRRNKSWRKIFERFNRSSSLRKEIQYPGEFCNMRVCWILCRLDHSIVIVTTLHKYKLLSCPSHPSHCPTSFVSPCYVTCYWRLRCFNRYLFPQQLNLVMVLQFTILCFHGSNSQMRWVSHFKRVFQSIQ